MDTWMWCPFCGVRQWFNWVKENTYTCSHCKHDIEVSYTRKVTL
jgi:acetyl-CoA carboxylase beta subunit